MGFSLLASSAIVVKTKKAALLGIGRSTLSTYNFLVKEGFSLVIWDDNEEVRKKYQNSNVNIVNYEDWNYEELDFIVSSPGIALYFPNLHKMAQLANNNHSLIVSDIELFQYYFKNTTYIGITGSNGKSTAVSMLAHMFSLANKSYALAGNIGIPIFDLAKEELKDYYILELSSFQISLFHKVRFNIAGILNISPNHDSYHGGYKNYQLAKLKIFENQESSDYALINKGEDYINSLNNNFIKAKVITVVTNSTNNNEAHAEAVNTNLSPEFEVVVNNSGVLNYKGNVINNNANSITVITTKQESSINLTTISQLQGKSFWQLMAFCYAVSKIVNIDTNTFIQSLKTFKGLPHRQYLVLEVSGIKFINDSKATTPKAAAAALANFNNIYWLLGGLRKSGDLEDVMPYLPFVKKVFIFGKNKDEFAAELAGKVQLVTFNTMEEAVIAAYHEAYSMANRSNSKTTTKAADTSIKLEPSKQVANEGVTVLLSPIGTSFDEFNNFEQRGDFFTSLVNKLAKNALLNKEIINASI